MKTVPNQKTIKVQKEKCDSNNLYACINLASMEQAAQDLDAGAFKLWCYFAKNQNGYEFALSSKAVEQTFNIKIKQYNNAVAELIAKRYLINTCGNNYIFREKAVIALEDNEEEKEKYVITKEDNSVITFGDNAVITKEDNPLLPLGIRNITDNTNNNTITNTTLNFADKPQNSTVDKIIVNYVPKATVKKKKQYIKPTINIVPLWMYEMV